MFGINGKNKKQKTETSQKLEVFLFNNYSHFVCTLRAVYFPIKRSFLYNKELYETLAKDDFH